MMTKVPEHQELRSHDVVADKRDELLRLFPEARTEDGRINFDTLRMVIGDVVDVGRERYGMTWPGKADSFRAIQSPSLATLRPAPDESVQFEITGNLIIEGDNLEVLKLLQKSYLGKVNMIYIDPPCNTGKDFIYPDDYGQSLQTYLEYTGQVDSMGRKFATNTDTQGRFHSQWLNMIYPRLYLARNLLREDGVIVISIDDAELRNLWRVCDEIFGEECYAGCISRATGTPTGDENKSLVNEIDYLLVYGRTPEVFVEGLPLSDKEAAIYDREDSQGRYLTRPLRRTGCDPDLRKMLGEFVREGRRCVRHVQEAGILPPDTLCHGDLLHYPPDTNRPSRQAMRDLWFAGALQATADADLVCVDPDNGIAKPDQMYQRRGPKFTYISDLRAFWERGQSLVVYQHLGHNVPAEAQIAAKAALLRDELGVEPIPLRFRRGAARVFFILPQPGHRERIEERIARMLDGPWQHHFERVGGGDE